MFKQLGAFFGSIGAFFKSAAIATAIAVIVSCVLYFLASSVWQWFPKVDLLIVGTLPLVLVGVGGVLWYIKEERGVEAALWWLLFCGVVPAGLIHNYFGQWPTVGFAVVFLGLTIFAIVRLAQTPKEKPKDEEQQQGTHQAPTGQVIGAQGQFVAQPVTPPGAQPVIVDFGKERMREVDAQSALALAKNKEADALTLQTLIAALPHLKEAAANDKSKITQDDVDAVLRRIAQLQESQRPVETPATLRAKRMKAAGTRVF